MPLSNILAITLLFSLPMLTTHSCKRHGVKTPLYLVIQRKYMVTQKTLTSLSLASMTERIRGKRIIFIPSYCYCCYVASVMSDAVRSHRWKPTRLPHPWDSPGKSTGVGYHFLLQCMKVKSESKVAQPCPTLYDPIDGSPPGSPIPGILQARVLELGAISFSRQKLLRRHKRRHISSCTTSLSPATFG